MTNPGLHAGNLIVYRTPTAPQRWLIVFDNGTKLPPSIELTDEEAAWLVQVLTNSDSQP